MKPEQNNLTAEDSLRIITEMIEQAKGNVKANSYYLLLWGWVIALINLGIFALLKLGYTEPYWLWLLVLPVWVFTMVKGFQAGRKGSSLTPLAKTNISIWIAYGITIFIIVGFGRFINFQLNAMILLVTAIPTLASGVILKFRPLIAGGVFFWIFGAVSFLVPYSYQSLISAAAIITGYLIPGYMLRRN
jgi:hypothetical protein